MRLERGADLHMAKLMPLPLTVSCFCKIQIGFTFLVPAHLGSPGKGPLNGCVCVCVVKLLSKRWWIPIGLRPEEPKLEPEGPRAEVGFPTTERGFSSIQGTLFGFYGIQIVSDARILPSSGELQQKRCWISIVRYRICY